jgi:hypothetical protein
MKNWADIPNYKTITLETAKRAVQVYNLGMYGCLKNPDIDGQALEMFATGLGSTEGEILRQVEFIGRNYGGAAGFRAAYALAPDIAHDIAANRDTYDQTARAAPSVTNQKPSYGTVSVLYRPFVKPLHGKNNWHVWATKFWRFLNHDAFPIEDSRVDKFFVLSSSASVDKYLNFVSRFTSFAATHHEWLPHLQKVDGNLAWCENKLWDKVCYGVVDLNGR